ncbi:MAG: hypothetical protein ACRDSR_03515 [Pseudonocardiaceae bacterium]
MLFLNNADRGANADNDVFVEDLLTRRRAIQALANPTSTGRHQITITDAGHARYMQLRSAARDHHH